VPNSSSNGRAAQHNEIAATGARPPFTTTLWDKAMKRLVEKQSEADLTAHYPRKGKTSGWYFRIDEVSNGVWQVQGSDQWGRCVSHTGSDPLTMRWARTKVSFRVVF
jgi:hypothetical protein